MARVYQIKDPAPSWGDQEAQWLVDTFDYEWEANDGAEGLGPQAHLVRITPEALRKVKRDTSVAKHVADCLDIMLNHGRQRWVDLLVLW